MVLPRIHILITSHALLLGFTSTCSLILALLGIEGVTDRDVETMFL